MKKRFAGLSLSILMVFSLVSGFAFVSPVNAEETLNLKQTVTNENKRPEGVAYSGDVLTVKMAMTNYSSLPADVEIDSCQIEIPIDTSRLEYVNGSAQVFLVDDNSLVRDIAYRQKDNRIVLMYVAKSDTVRLSKTNSDMLQFQVRVKDTITSGDTVSMPVDTEESYFGLNRDTDIPYSCSNIPVITLKEYKPLDFKTKPTKLDYIEGQDLDLTGGVLYYTPREGGDVTEVAMTDPSVTVEGYNKNPEHYGDQSLTVTYKGESTNLVVNVAQKTATDLVVTKAPSPKPVDAAVPQTNYIEGQEWGILSDGTLKINYNNGASDTMAITDAMLTPPSLNAAGTANVAVKWGNLTTSYPITIEAKQPSSIRLDPSVVNAKVNGSFDATQIKVYTKYNNGTEDAGTALTVTEMANAPDLTTVGPQVIEVTHNTKKANLTVNVLEKELTGIAIETIPTPVKFIEGTQFKTSGGKLKLTYDNGTSEVVDITSTMVKEPDMLKVGPAKATVMYDKFTATYDVEIVAKSVYSIAMGTLPKTNYIEGEQLNLQGGSLNVIYTNGTSGKVDLTDPLVKVTGFDSSKPVDSQKLTVSYGSATTSYDVKIVEKQVTGIRIKDLPATNYFVGDKMDLTNGTLTVSYDNGTTGLIKMTDTGVTVDGFTTEKVGTYPLSVSYAGVKTTYSIAVITKDRVDAFAAKIEKINPNALTLADESLIEGLVTEYNALLDIEKAALPKSTIEQLNQLVTTMNQLIEANKKSETIVTPIPTVQAPSSPNTGLMDSANWTMMVLVSLIALTGVGITSYHFRHKHFE